VKVLVGGDTAIFVDFAHVLSAKLPLFIGLVVMLSFLLLIGRVPQPCDPADRGRRHEPALHRSRLRRAGGGRPVGGCRLALRDHRTGPVEAFLPVMLFAILFGLSMDYQVFLVSRMHEEYLKSGGDNRIAVRNGLAATGKTITAAALIMILVFGSFILGGQPWSSRSSASAWPAASWSTPSSSGWPSCRPS
jgi:RND superfamily putative drug exporter